MVQSSAIHRHFLSRVMCGSMRITSTRRLLRTCVTSDRPLTVRDRQNLLCDMAVDAWIRRWLHCGRRCLCVLRCVGSEVDCVFVRCHEELEYDKDLSTFMGLLIGSSYPKFVRRLSCYIVRLFTRISSNASTTALVTA